MDFHEIGGKRDLANNVIGTQGALGIQVNAEGFTLDGSARASLFPGFRRSAFTGGQGQFQPPFRERPLVGTGIDEEKLNRSAARAVADGRHLWRVADPQFAGDCPRKSAYTIRAHVSLCTTFAAFHHIRLSSLIAITLV